MQDRIHAAVCPHARHATQHSGESLLLAQKDDADAAALFRFATQHRTGHHSQHDCGRVLLFLRSQTHTQIQNRLK